MSAWKISSGLWVFAGTQDRYATEGYGPQLSPEEAIERAGKVEDLEGIEIHYPATVNEKNLNSVKQKLDENNLEVTFINLDLWGSKRWKDGSLTSSEEDTRKEAVKIGKKAIKMAKELDCENIGIWPGQDGFDYPFQADYKELWEREIEGVKKIAKFDENMNIGIEYKPKEPRNYQLISDVGKALLLVREIDLKNVGVVLDFGHALNSGETPGESVYLLSRANKLFNIHINDNYRDWDDDMVVGSVNIWETLEFLYYLDKVNYDGYIGLDQYPYREDPVEAAELSVKNIHALTNILEEIDKEELESAQHEQDALRAMRNILSILEG